MSTDNMFRWDQDDAGIVTLTMDDPNAPVNTCLLYTSDAADEVRRV